MKKFYLPLLLMLLITLMASCTSETSYNADEPSEELTSEEQPTYESAKVSFESGYEITLTQIKEKIADTENLVRNIFPNKYDSENTWLDERSGVDAMAFAGDNSIEYAAEKTEGYCSEKALRILLEKDNMAVNENGEVGILMADGEVIYPNYDENSMTFISSRDDSMEVLVKRSDDFYPEPYHNVRNFIYTLKETGNDFIIDDIKEQLEDGTIVEVHGVW